MHACTYGAHLRGSKLRWWMLWTKTECQDRHCCILDLGLALKLEGNGTEGDIDGDADVMYACTALLVSAICSTCVTACRRNASSSQARCLCTLCLRRITLPTTLVSCCIATVTLHVYACMHRDVKHVYNCMVGASLIANPLDTACMHARTYRKEDKQLPHAYRPSIESRYICIHAAQQYVARYVLLAHNQYACKSRDIQ